MMTRECACFVPFLPPGGCRCVRFFLCAALDATLLLIASCMKVILVTRLVVALPLTDGVLQSRQSRISFANLFRVFLESRCDSFQTVIASSLCLVMVFVDFSSPRWQHHVTKRVSLACGLHVASPGLSRKDLLCDERCDLFKPMR